MKRYGIDLDGTLTIETEGQNYADRTPYWPMINVVNELYFAGDHITLFTARYPSDRTVTKRWLDKHGVMYHKLILGKPRFDIYVDDVSITPQLFLGVIST